MHMPCGCSGVGRGRSTSMLPGVSGASLKSLRLAPAATVASGTPLASVSRLRFAPFLALSVGFGPVFFPSQRSLGHRAIHGEPAPVDALEFIIGEQPVDPELLKNSCLHPLLKAPVRRGVVAEAGGIQGSPLAARSEHEENRVHGVTIRDPRIVAAQRVRLWGRQQGFHFLPELVRDAPAIIFNYKSQMKFSFLLQETSATASQFQALLR